MMYHIPESALVIFSGGQDSATCLGWALETFSSVATIGFHYGQRHDVEMQCRANVLHQLHAMRSDWSSRLLEDAVFGLELLSDLGETALTHDVAITMDSRGLPNTFVPGRNLLFMNVAAAYAYRKGIRHIVLGVCETDFSGYPDCRDDAVKAMQVALNVGMAEQFVMHTPLMWLNKASTWELARSVGGDALVECILEHSHTCYKGDRSVRHDWGYGCAECPACVLRQAGWESYKAGHATPKENR